jgi:hypothetical protein
MSNGRILDNVGMPSKTASTCGFFEIYLGHNQVEQFKRQDAIHGDASQRDVSPHVECSDNVFIIDYYFT